MANAQALSFEAITCSRPETSGVDAEVHSLAMLTFAAPANHRQVVMTLKNAIQSSPAQAQDVVDRLNQVAGDRGFLGASINICGQPLKTKRTRW